MRRERGFGINPWSTHTRFLVSQRLLIDEAYVGPLRDWLGDFRGGSLLILDEAHHAAPASGQKYAIDSKITRAVRDLARRFEHRLFLSATPHNGHSNSFSALLEILDPQRSCRGVPATRKALEEVMVRRLKDDIREIVGGFPERKVVQVNIDGLPSDAPELQLSRLLDQYRSLRELRLKDETRRKQASAGLLISGLQQRLLSSIEAFAKTLRVHRRTVMRQWEEANKGKQSDTRTPASLDLLAGGVGADDDRATLSEEELDAELEAQVEAATASTSGPMTDATSRGLFAREQALLDEMTEIAESGRGRPDARVRKFVDWMRKNQCPGLPTRPGQPASGAKWTDTRVIIFTEYDDTKRYLQQQLSARIEGTDQADHRIAIYHGPTPPAKRKEIQEAFQAKPSKHPVRILIATDAAREGLNLQAHCWNLFHFDVPWNPSRMEQRNGRIDRKLQPKDKVFCHYFFYKQRPEDRILAALVRKTKTIREELGSLSQVIDARLDRMMGGGIRRDRVDAMEQEIDDVDFEAEQRRTVEEELETTRERQDVLRAQIDRLRNRLEESQEHIGLKEDHFRSAISCALELLGADRLQPAKDGSNDGRVEYRFPALDQREGADPTWADTMDTLRAPRKRDQKPWEWRRTSPIRPVVFEDPGNMTDEVVHLHLEQRVVQRLLGRFTAQGFVHHDLSRACLAQTTDAIPRVVLLGRLCLYGPGAARLHEELVPVTARWTDLKLRKGKLRPYSREAETKTLDLLEEALLLKTGKKISDTVLKQLLSTAARDVEELLPHLETRAREYAKDAEKKLVERGEAEAKAMLKILQDQQKHIEKTAAKYEKDDPRQLKLQFPNDDERRQLEANKRHWAKRLLSLERELETEFGERTSLKTYRADPASGTWSDAAWPGTPPAADETTWAYDPATGLLETKTYADAEAVTYTYRADGKLSVRTWARPDGLSTLSTTYTYYDDAVNNTGELERIDYSDSTPDVDFDLYDRMGRMSQVSDAVGTRTFSFDDDLNPDKEIINTSGNQQLYYREITREYEPEPVVFPVPSGLIVGRPKALKVGVSGDEARDYQSDYRYQVAGRVDRITGPGLPSTGAVYLYETDADLVKEIDYKQGAAVLARSVRIWDADRAALTTVRNKWGTTLISRYRYEYDTLGRRKHVIRKGRAFPTNHSDVWAYNERNELSRSDRFDDITVPLTSDPDNTKDFAYAYDNIGNREDYTIGTGSPIYYCSNELNQYDTLDSTSACPPLSPDESFTYDEDGNMKTDGTFKYTWDAENRLILVEPVGTPVNDDKKLEFTYDYRGRRVRKQVSTHNGTVWNETLDHSFVYDGWNLLLELDENDGDEIVRKYSWGLDLSGNSQGEGGIGGLLSMHEPGTPAEEYFYLYDANGNVGQLVAWADGYGSATAGEWHLDRLVAHYEYDPYGGMMYSSGAYKTDNPFRFSTKYWDDESGLGYWAYRYCSARSGRWLSRDPIGVTGGFALYSFVSNDPVNLTDAIGFQTSQPTSTSKPCCCCCAEDLVFQGLTRILGGQTFKDPAGRELPNFGMFGHYFEVNAKMSFKRGCGGDCDLDWREKVKWTPDPGGFKSHDWKDVLKNKQNINNGRWNNRDPLDCAKAGRTVLLLDAPRVSVLQRNKIGMTFERVLEWRVKLFSGCSKPGACSCSAVELDIYQYLRVVDGQVAWTGSSHGAKSILRVVRGPVCIR